MVLRWFRGERDIPKLGRDHRVSRATAYRYIPEGIDVLAAQAPDLHDALDRAHADGLAYVILDGTLIPIDRCAEQTLSVKGEPIDAWYSGKAHQHAGNLQALSAPGGLPLWIGEVEPGSVHDLTAARTHVLGALYAAAAAGLPTLADSGYDGHFSAEGRHHRVPSTISNGQTRPIPRSTGSGQLILGLPDPAAGKQSLCGGGTAREPAHM